jgi:hypothetical protein
MGVNFPELKKIYLGVIVEDTCFGLSNEVFLMSGIKD